MLVAAKYAKPLLWLGLALAIIVAGVLLYFAGLFSGGSDVERQHAIEQLELNEELRKRDEQIDRNAPDGTDKRDGIDWLLKHTRKE